MNEAILKKAISVFAAEVGLEEEELSADSALLDDLGMNSMEIMNSLGTLEKVYSIRISEKDLRHFVTVGDVVDFISQKT